MDKRPQYRTNPDGTLSHESWPVAPGNPHDRRGRFHEIQSLDDMLDDEDTEYEFGWEIKNGQWTFGKWEK